MGVGATNTEARVNASVGLLSATIHLVKGGISNTLGIALALGYLGEVAI